jgi:hypothetical protein
MPLYLGKRTTLTNIKTGDRVRLIEVSDKTQDIRDKKGQVFIAENVYWETGDDMIAFRLDPKGRLLHFYAWRFEKVEDEIEPTYFD